MMSELQDVATNLNVAVKNIQNGTTRLPEITDAVADGTKDLPGPRPANAGFDARTGAVG